MEQRQPIFWYQGLFLQPQHLQQNDLHFQSLLYHFQAHQQPYFWGVCKIDIFEPALNNRMFEISAGEFIFQDGTLVSFPDNAVMQPRSFKGSWAEEKPLTVYLGLRKWNVRGENVSVLNTPDVVSAATTRFIYDVNPREVKDIHNGGLPAQLKLLNYLLKVFWEDEIGGAGDYELIPVACLEREMDDIKLSRRFVPPSVSVSSSGVLAQTMKNIREQVTARCRMLEEYKVPREAQSSDMGFGFVIYLLALRSLNRYVPLLHHVTEAPAVHPWCAYGLLRQLVGELSTFTDRVDALGRLRDGSSLLPDYDHYDIGGCFDEAQILIGELLNEITLGAENVIRLVREDGNFKASIPLDTFDSRNVFYIVVGTSQDREEMLHMLQNVAKVSSEEYMPTLIKRALPGIPLEHSVTPMPGLPKRSGSLFFRIDRSSDHWLEIQKRQNICMHWNEAPEDTTVELIIVRK
jgi:type VI secretion system protein ImpJ